MTVKMLALPKLINIKKSWHIFCWFCQTDSYLFEKATELE